MSPLLRYIRTIISLMGKHSRQLPILLGFGIVLGIIDILGLGFVAQFVSVVLGGGAKPAISIPLAFDTFAASGYILGGLLVVIFLVRAALGVLSFWYINSVAGRVEADLKATLLLDYQRMAYETRVARGESELVNAINLWTSQYVRVVLLPFARSMSEALIGIMILMFLGYASLTSLLLFALLIGTVGVVYDISLRRRGQNYAKTFRAISTQVVSDVQQGLEGYKEIRVFGLEEFFQKRIKSSADIMCSALAKANTISQSPRLIIEAVVVVFVVASLYFAGAALGDTTHLLPVLAMFAVGGMRIVSLASLVSSTIFNLRLYRPMVTQLAADYAQASLSVHKGGVLHDRRLVQIEVDGLDFSYRNAPRRALQNISFRCLAGENLAIVGPSGSGKTTLIDLLLGILEPTSGAINVHCVGGVQHTLVGVASYLPQTTFILNDSLRRNVALGLADEEVDDARVISALQKAKLPQFANTQSLDMSLGDRGCRISGGQRQRVALARAFYLGRNVLILDEATNALDLETETEIVKDLLDLRNEITLIAITHRPEIAKLFARKLMLVDGMLSQP